jgi:hypothetical protein
MGFPSSEIDAAILSQLTPFEPELRLKVAESPNHRNKEST